MHATLKITGCTVMFSGAHPGRPLVVGNNSVIISNRDIDEIKLMFNKRKLEGTVVMTFKKYSGESATDFSIDKFRIGWQLSYDSE